MNFHILAKKNFGPGVNKHSARDLEEDQSNYRAWAALQIPVAWMEIRSFFL